MTASEIETCSTSYAEVAQPGTHATLKAKLERVVIVASVGPRNSNGGINSLFELTRNVREFELTLVTQRNAELLDKWRNTNISTRVIPFAGYVRFWLAQLKFRKLFRQLKPRAVVCNDIRAMLCAAPIARSLGIPVVFFVRDIFEPKRKYGLKWRMAAQLANVIAVLSTEMESALRERLRPLTSRQLNLRTLYSNVDLENMSPVTADERQKLRRDLGMSEEEFAIVVTAGFCAKKNQLGLIAALPELFQRVPMGKVHFVGDFVAEDPYCAQCTQLADKLGVAKKIAIHGYSSRISNWYQAADCTLLASRREGLARAMIESLACGTPVVSFNVSSAHEILTAYECGFVVEQDDYQGLFAAVASIAEQDELRTRMAKNGRTMSESLFDPTKNTERFVALLRSF